MAYELYNGGSCKLSLTLPMPWGTLEVNPREMIPTPEQEKTGLTARALKEFEGPSFLTPTPPALRREFLEKAGLPVPEDLLARTRHMEEFQRVARGGKVAKGALPPKGGASPRGGPNAPRAPQAPRAPAQAQGNDLNEEKETPEQFAARQKQIEERERAAAFAAEKAAEKPALTSKDEKPPVKSLEESQALRQMPIDMKQTGTMRVGEAAVALQQEMDRKSSSYKGDRKERT